MSFSEPLQENNLNVPTYEANANKQEIRNIFKSINFLLRPINESTQIKQRAKIPTNPIAEATAYRGGAQFDGW